jgi:hypothetical protein
LLCYPIFDASFFEHSELFYPVECSLDALGAYCRAHAIGLVVEFRKQTLPLLYVRTVPAAGGLLGLNSGNAVSSASSSASSSSPFSITAALSASASSSHHTVSIDRVAAFLVNAVRGRGVGAGSSLGSAASSSSSSSSASSSSSPSSTTSSSSSSSSSVSTSRRSLSAPAASTASASTASERDDFSSLELCATSSGGSTTSSGGSEVECTILESDGLKRAQKDKIVAAARRSVRCIMINAASFEYYPEHGVVYPKRGVSNV